MVSLEDRVHVVDKQNIVIYSDFDCGIIAQAPTKVKRINPKRKKFRILWKLQVDPN